MQLAKIAFIIYILIANIYTVSCTKACTTQTIRNDVPRVDDRGIVMDAHDGNVIFYQDVYYWYAASYGNCMEPSGGSGCSVASPGACGFRFDHNVSVWSSTDLFHWKYGGVVFQASTVSPPSIMFCPKVIHNPSTKMFVLWVNLVRDGFSTSYYSSATSASPFGPFKTVAPNITSLANPNVGDFNLMTGPGGDAYVIYTAWITGGGPGGNSHVMTVEKLSPDYLGTLGSKFNSGPIGETFVEAPAFIYSPKSQYYIAVFGHCCCYCKEGSPVSVYVSKNPMGPYTQRGTGPIDDGSVSSQQTDIFPFVTDSTGALRFMWVGDRWQQSPNGKKSDDPTYWALLDVAMDGTISNFSYVPSFQVTVCN